MWSCWNTWRACSSGICEADRAEVLEWVVYTLPEAQNEALLMAFYRGMSQRQIAAETGIPLGTIKTRLDLAVRKVRTAILTLGGAGEWAPGQSQASFDSERRVRRFY